MTVRLPAAQRRAQLLRTALDEFGAKGYHGTSMNDIAEAAGVTKPVLYQHFESKDELFLAVMRDVGDRLWETIDAAASAANGPREQVDGGFAAYFAFFAHQPAAFNVLFGGGAGIDPSFLAEADRIGTAISEHIADFLHDVDPAVRFTLAAAVVGLSERAMGRWMREGRPGEPADIAKTVADLAWFGLRGAPGAERSP